MIPSRSSATRRPWPNWCDRYPLLNSCFSTCEIHAGSPSHKNLSSVAWPGPVAAPSQDYCRPGVAVAPVAGPLLARRRCRRAASARHPLTCPYCTDARGQSYHPLECPYGTDARGQSHPSNSAHPRQKTGLNVFTAKSRASRRLRQSGSTAIILQTLICTLIKGHLVQR